MKSLSIAGHQTSERVNIASAAILSAPLWASGLVFLAVLFAITRHGHFYSLQFLAMAVGIVVVSTVAALRVMDRNAQRLRMQLRSKRVHRARFT